MKNILLLLHEDSGQEARLQVALDVTRALSGHLIGLDVYALPTVYVGFSGYPTEDLAIAEVRAQEDQFLLGIQDRLAKKDVPWSLRTAYGDTNAALAEAADLADLIVVSSRSGRHDEDAHVRPGSLPLKARRPMLAVPPECRGIALDDSALIAWDGSDEASQAMRQAIPLLKLARSVTICQVGSEPGENSLEDASAYLSRHGVHPKEIERLGYGRVAPTLQQVARDESAGYIVMGSYGSGRTLEVLFGGVTRTMLRESEVPLFIGH